MEPIINKLNEAALNKVRESNPGIGKTDQSFSFQQVLDNKVSQNQFFEKLEEKLGLNERSDMTVLSANDIQIKSSNPELGERIEGFNDGDKTLTGFIKRVDDNAKHADRMIELLSTPGTKFTSRELLTIQASLGPAFLSVTLLGKVVESGTRAAQTMLQMNT